ncbi:MAG: hypothetical protein WCD47_19175 [Candidatus Sulfotelmatobacter sp.]
MKNILVVLVIVAVSMPLSGQTPTTKRVILSPKSNLDTASVSEGFAKYCPNVVVTETTPKPTTCWRHRVE